jgi:hypothetical protein
MKNLIVLNIQNNSSKRDELLKITKAQIENSLELGWDKNNIILISNVDFEWMEVKSIKIELNRKCVTGSKMYAVKYLFDNGEKDILWSHDLDAWQNYWFDEPEFKDAGASEYSQPKFNGGSVFWKPQSIDIINSIIQQIESNEQEKEEPTINKLFRSRKYKDRVTVLNYTYNVGCSGFIKRAHYSIKPIKVSHLHPTNRIAWETHALDRNGVGYKSISGRLENLLRKYYPSLATELQEDGKNKQNINIQKMMSGVCLYA